MNFSQVTFGCGVKILRKSKEICEKCPRMQKGICPNDNVGCVAREKKMCQICSCAFSKGVKLCFECQEFPCETTKKGPISYGYYPYISSKP